MSLEKSTSRIDLSPNVFVVLRVISLAKISLTRPEDKDKNQFFVDKT